MNWKLLGIEPTKDKKEITAAYRQQLRKTNPEDKPDAFKALRAAYEEALRLADQQEAAAVRDDTPVGRWISDIADLYHDFPSRIDPEKWVPLLRADVCLALDTRPAAEEAILRFLMKDYYLPRSVLTLIDGTFRFTERLDELRENYPQEFLDHVIVNGVRLDPALPYELFEPGKNADDCDSYIRLYFQAIQMPVAESAAVLEQMEALSESHPYGKIMRLRYWLEQGERERAEKGFRELTVQYPNDPQVLLTWASMCLETENINEAEAIAGRILERLPMHISAKGILARCYGEKGAYDEAKELLFENIRASGSDPVIINYYVEQIHSWNERIIPVREERMREDPSDADNIIELGWCYIQNDRMEDAVEISRNIDKEKAEPYKYHNYMGKLYHNLQEFSDALEHLRVTEKLLKDMQPDGTDETKKRLQRLPEILQIEGGCLMQLRQNEEAREKFEEALRLAPEDPDILILMGKILYTTGDYEYAVEILERVIQLSPGSWHSNLLLALTLYRLRRDREAFAAVNRALSMQSKDLSLYIMQLQILIRNGVWEEVHSVLDFLKESGAPEDIAIDFVKAQLTELEAKDTKAAFAQYQKIARRVEADEPLMWASDLYYRMALLMSDSMDMDREEDRELLLTMLDKGLAHYEQDPDCLAYKAWILQRGGKLQEAIDLYRNLLEKNSHSVAAQQGLSELYYNNLSLYAREALEHYEKLLAVRRSPELYFYAASCKRQLGDLEGARRYYLMELEADPDDADGYNGLAYICDAEGKYDASLAYLDQAIKAMMRVEKRFLWLFEHKVLVLRRLGRFEEALAVVDDVMKSYDYFAGHQLKFDICCQCGMWDRANAVLDSWKKGMPSDPELMQAKGRLYLLSGKMFKAVFAMGKAKRILPYEDVQSFRLQLAELECNFPRQIEILSRRAKAMPDDDHTHIGLARALKWSGRDADSLKAAQRALELLDATLEQNLTDEALFRGRRSLALALLGRVEEARAELDRTRKLPLCEHCPYGSCKDADIYEAEIEEIAGNREGALTLYRTGHAKWPDDLDFTAGEARCKRKVK